MRATEFIRENVEHFNGLDFSIEIEKDDEYVDDDDTDNQTIYVRAFANGRELGHVLFTIDYDGQGIILKPQDLEVDERFQGQGIAATMYDYVKSKGYRIRRSGQQTDAGAGFWNKHRPKQNVWEQGVAEGKKRRRRNKSFGGYWYPGYGYYGSSAYGGESGDSGAGDGGGGESVTEAKNNDAVAELKAALLAKKDQIQSATDDDVYAIIDSMMTRIAKSHDISGKELHDLWVGKYKQIPDKWIMKESDEQTSSDNAIFLNPNAVILGQEHGKKLKLSPKIAKKVKDIAEQHGAWYEGNGMDRELTAGIIDDYQGSWDDDLLSPSVKGYPAPFLYVLFSNIKENDTVEGKIGFDPNSSIFDRILSTQPSTNYFPNRRFDADTLRKFLQAVSEGPYDFVRMSQAPATESNVRRFFTLGEQLMFPDNWEEYPYRAGRVAKSVNDLRDRFLATRKQGVYVAGSDHLKAVQQFLDQSDDLVVTEDKDKNKSQQCARTKSAKCQCDSVKKITETQETVSAICVLEHSDKVKGTILFEQQSGYPTLIVGQITGLAPGAHGFHIHEFGDLSDGCESAGKHYNPDGVDHGDINSGHVGDLGNITADKNGRANFRIVARRVSLSGDRSVVGRAIVIHENQDDLGRGSDQESLKTGNAGDRLACGVITLRNSLQENFADGKIKGKSRPGRVKRAGASCAGSVTSLRQKAKNTGGERAKMYHWCANMKSGRKK